MKTESVHNKLRLGYGSEFHLLRMLGRHRLSFSNAVEQSLGNGVKIEWFDFPFSIEKNEFYDHEYFALGFLKHFGLDPYEENQKYYKYWPKPKVSGYQNVEISKGQQHWDAVGKTDDGRIVLLEAKAHINELQSTTKATAGLIKIEEAFKLTREGIGVEECSSWTSEYYQFANHIFTCWYLNKVRNIPAVLVNVFFVGDIRPDNYFCPQTITEWERAINLEYKHLGISEEMPFIKETVRTCYINVAGRSLEK